MERNFRKTLIIENVLTNDFGQNTNIVKKENVRNSKKIVFNSVVFYNQKGKFGIPRVRFFI